jgi:hypothetical protein
MAAYTASIPAKAGIQYAAGSEFYSVPAFARIPKTAFPTEPVAR